MTTMHQVLSGKVGLMVALAFSVCGMASCQNSSGSGEEELSGTPDRPVPENEDHKRANIDLSHWKVTLPIGAPTEVEPPEILDYASNEILQEFMYNDTVDGALVFYAYPANSTANSSYSRTELREQIEPGDNRVNWTFKEGGRMKGTLSVPEVSRDSEGKPHRVIVMQIHGRLTDDQRDLIGEDDNNAPPMLKIFWNKGYVRVKTKVLKNPNAVVPEILHVDAWKDDEGHTFKAYVGDRKFTLEVIASDGRLEVVFNDDEKVVYQGSDMKKWGVFENYFKAGNYLITRDTNAFSRVKFYDLHVSH